MLALAGLVGLGGCAPHAGEDVTLDASVDASASAAQPASDGVRATLSTVGVAGSSPQARLVADQIALALAKEPVLAARFAPNADGITNSSVGVTSPGWRSAWTDRHNHVGARLPASASEPFEAGVGISELYRLGITHVGANAAPLALDAGRAVYREVYPSTDVTFAASAERLEWAYTLRDDKAPTTIELAIALPKNLVGTKLVKPGALDFLDEGGHSLLRVPQPLAIDAKGTERAASLAWTAGRLTVSLDTAGLAYPIVLDPAVETVVWEARVQVPNARYEASAAYDSARSRVVLFGGRATAQYGDTWEFDGAVWSLRATSGPSARNAAAMTYDAARGVSVLFGGDAVVMMNDTWEWDGTAWNRKCMTSPCSDTLPSTRRYGAMAYDAAHASSVLFGGYAVSGALLSDTWTWNGTAWTQRAAAPGALTARQRHSMTYDTTTSRVLLFGGTDASSKRNDLWSFDGATWTAKSPAGGPPPAREGTTFLYESATGKALLFAGLGAASYLSDAWEYASASNTWVAAAAGPTTRGYHAGAYDSSRASAVIFGGLWSGAIGDTWEFKGGAWSKPGGLIGEKVGATAIYDKFRNRTVLFGGGNAPPYLSETWEWNGFLWVQVCTTAPCSTTTPAGRWAAGGAYDSTRHQFVLFGGDDSSPRNDTWTYDGNAWTQLLPATKPTARRGVAMAYDAVRDRTVLFGGSTGAGETWEWNGATWTLRCPGAGCTGSPSARFHAAMIFDSARGKAVLFGGVDTGFVAAKGDTWEWDGATWTNPSTTGPAARHYPQLSYDVIRKTTVLFGGRSGGSPLGDTWEWNGSTWTQTATPAQGPGNRYLATFDYDGTRRRDVLFGGSGTANYADTWEHYTHGGACSLGAQCSTGYCTDGVCCEQLSCGTCEACNTAAAPGVCTTVTDADDPDTCPSAVSSCDSNGSCKKKQGQGCSAGQACASGFCADGYCCDKACDGGCDVCNTTPGTCTTFAKGTTGASPACGPYLCDGAAGACPSSCAADTDCASGFFCASGGICQARRAAGGSCNTGTGGDCAVTGCRECGGTLACKDGVCCGSACTGSCQTCAATLGTCTTVKSADDADTCTGASTCSSSGSCLAKLGQACSAASQCASGYCVDGFCCNAACAGGCDVCSATPGTCTIVAQGSAGASPACSAYVCNGSAPACPTACGNDADCASSYYCARDGTCQARKAQGASCNLAAIADCRSAGCRACSSNNCIDGYCCDSACAGACNACNGADLAWSGASNGSCKLAPLSYAGGPSCGAFACDGASASCPAGCSSDSQCGSGYYCSASGACVAQKAQGASCNLASDCKVSGTCRACATGNCVDGYCCNTACGSQCEACDVGGALGTCVTVTGNAHVNASLPARTAVGTSCGALCDGTSGTSCAFPKSNTCSAASCAAGVASSVGTCNGSGTCSQTQTPCGAYACGTTTCKTSCTVDADCAGAGYYCGGGSCQLKKNAGDTCTASNACASGNCVSGVCCDTACGTSGYSCTISGSVGTCKKVNGTTCAASSECGSGICADGVCCNSACNGQCQACNLAGSAGTCSNVYGAPTGSRPACGGAGVGTSCGALCDGLNGTSCTFPTANSCSAASCAGGVESTSGACDGKGACAFTTKACGAYLCGATSCKSVCTNDADCATDFYCKVGTCAPKENKGTACTAASACLSGNCVDGTCCSSAACGAGERCNVAGSLGTCAKPNGVACGASTECASSFCVDGVCCDSKCGAQCASCDLTGKVGTCSATSGAPRGGRAACAGTSGECGAVCNGSDVTACHHPLGSTSCGANTCRASGGNYVETHVSVCDGAGACGDDPKTCGGFVCGATACKAACTANGDCTTGYYCKSGACIPIEGLGTTCLDASTCTSGFCTDGVCCALGSCGAGKSCSAGLATLKGLCVSLNGTGCSADTECASGACVDGVCCDGACNGPCEACNRPGSVGKCVPIVGTPLTGHPSCSGSSTDADCAQRCDGSTGASCKYPGTTATCGAPSCGGGEETQVSTCDGAGSCRLAQRTCAPYVCGTTSCLGSCTKNGDCASGNYCLSGACVKVAGLGKSCGASAECDSGFCADGVCCSAASCGAGSSCAADSSLTPGACLKKQGVACTRADDCASGRCVDGVCCDSACNGQCEACDVAGSEGKCTPVVGAPRLGVGGRVACDNKDATDCAKSQCDGKTRDKCAGFANGGTTACGADTCTVDKRFQKRGACDGVGGCALPDPKPCTPYACDATTSSGCKTTCATEDDCAADYKCEAGACVQGARCSDDGLSSIAKTGEVKACTPYRCGADGKCETSCAGSEDCAPGLLCDPTVKACVIENAAPTDSSGGCAVGPVDAGGRTSGTGAGVLAALALIGAGAVRRRRRAASQ